jgi:D-beta-D-heptose 7-phosphate kinase/D-beta-D-heptose 1-phosphate adenosyltransferase
MSPRFDSASNILASLAGKTILVVGDLIVDEYLSGEVRRISPEAPVPIVEFGSRVHVPGGAGNVAANVAALGCRPLLMGVVGSDPEADSLSFSLRNANVPEHILITDADRPTTLKTRVVAHDQQVLRIDREIREPISAQMEQRLVSSVEQHLSTADACILSDYGKGVLTPHLACKIIAMCRGSAVPTLVDPKSLDVPTLRGSTLIKPNLHEAERLANNSLKGEHAFLAGGIALAHSFADTAVLITRGSLGMSLFRRDLPPFHLSTAARTVYDVTGAGDTVISMLAAAMATRMAHLEEAAYLASQAAAVVLEKRGTATATAAEIKAMLARQPATEASFLSGVV